MKLLALPAMVLAGCTPYMSAGYDTRTKVSGPVANLITQPAASALTDAPMPPVEDTRSYSFAAGGGGKRLGVELGGHLQDVNGASFSLPSSSGVDLSSPRYLLVTGSIDVRFRWLLAKYFASDVHIGPARAILLDRAYGEHVSGSGYRFGVTVAAKLGPVSAFADLYETDMSFDEGPARGTSTLTGVTLGVALR